MIRVVWVALLAALIALSGCGGDNGSFERETIEATMTEGVRGELPAGVTMDPLKCVQDGDDEHWRCNATALQGEQRYSLTLAVTCDPDTGRCLSEPFALIPRNP